MATQCAPGHLHSEGKIRVFAVVVHSVGVCEYGHYTAQVQESLLHHTGQGSSPFQT